MTEMQHIPRSTDQLAAEMAKAGGIRTYLEQLAFAQLRAHFSEREILDAADITPRHRRRLKKKLQGGPNRSACQ